MIYIADSSYTDKDKVEFRKHRETGDDFEKVVHLCIVGKILEKILFIFGWKKFESF